ncbi:DUF6339 family protein [Pedococcus soli]
MVLTEDAVDALWSNLANATTAADFLETTKEITTNPENLLRLPFDLGVLPALKADGPRGSFEFDNAIDLYEALGPMPRVAAADPRLWSYLAFGPYSDYMSARWSPDGVRNWRARFNGRWLVRSATTGSLIRHGLARLWWLAELTYDPHLERSLSKEHADPWWYLRVALAREDRIMALFDREAGSIDNLRFALLDLCDRDSVASTEDGLRALMKEVTLSYGYRDLAALSAEETDALLRSLIPAV